MKLILADGSEVELEELTPMLKEYAELFPGEPYLITDPRVTRRGLLAKVMSVEAIWAAEFLGRDCSQWSTEVARCLNERQFCRTEHLYQFLDSLFGRYNQKYKRGIRLKGWIRVRYYVPRIDFLPPLFLDQMYRERHRQVFVPEVLESLVGPLEWNETHPYMLKKRQYLMLRYQKGVNCSYLRNILSMPHYSKEGRLERAEYFTNVPNDQLVNLGDWWVSRCFFWGPSFCPHFNPMLQRLQEVWFK